MASLLSRRVVRRGQLVLTDQDQVYQLGEAPLIIGRDREQCGLCIQKKTISRRHAQVIQENGNWYLEDFGSISGTFLNEVRIESSKKYPISPNDVIRVADHPLRVELKMEKLEERNDEDQTTALNQLIEKEASGTTTEADDQLDENPQEVVITSPNQTEMVESAQEKLAEIMVEDISKDAAVAIVEIPEEIAEIKDALESDTPLDLTDGDVMVAEAVIEEKEMSAAEAGTCEKVLRDAEFVPEEKIEVKEIPVVIPMAAPPVKPEQIPVFELDAVNADAGIQALKESLDQLIKGCSFNQQQIETLKKVIGLAMATDYRHQNTMMTYLNERLLKQPATISRVTQPRPPVVAEASDYTTMIGVQPVIEQETLPTQPQRRVIRRDAAGISHPEETMMPINPYQTISEPMTPPSVQEVAQNYGICPMLHPILIDGERVEIPITKTPFTIGKSAQHGDFQLNARGISRAHCLITFHDGHYFASDLGSTNGVFVNKKRLKPHKEFKIKSSDKITLGVNQFIFEIPR